MHFNKSKQKSYIKKFCSPQTKHYFVAVDSVCFSFSWLHYRAILKGKHYEVPVCIVEGSAVDIPVTCAALDDESSACVGCPTC